MKALVLKKVKTPLVLDEVSKPTPGQDEILIKITACGICRTDLHIIDGELLTPLPLIPGHQIVGIIEDLGSNVKNYQIGDSVGVAWLGHSCQTCNYCLDQQENLCNQAIFTGFHINGGYAEYTTAHYQFIFPLPTAEPHWAPLLCAGMIGYRSLKKCGNAKRIGFYGFGAAAHLLIQTAISLGKEIYVFTRPGDNVKQQFAKSLHAAWVGGCDEIPPSPLDAAIIFAPEGALVPTALSHLRKGGIAVCAGIHMSDIPTLPYHLLWGERILTSVANLTRQDGIEFLSLASHIKPHITTYFLHEGTKAIDDFRLGKIQGSPVLVI